MFQGLSGFEHLILIFQILLNIHYIDSSEITEFAYGYELMLLLIQVFSYPFQQLSAVSFTSSGDSLDILWIYANSGCFHVKYRCSKIQILYLSADCKKVLIRFISFCIHSCFIYTLTLHLPYFFGSLSPTRHQRNEIFVCHFVSLQF